MKKIISALLLCVLVLTMVACGKSPATIPAEPEIVQMRAICELSTMKCYYHNVAKYFDEDASKGFLGIGKKDKHFWVEYSAEVELGIDASLVTMEISDTQVTITIPPAKVLDKPKVYSESLSKESYIIAKDSADVTAQDETTVLADAQEDIKALAEADKTLLTNAQDRAKMLLEDYVTNIGKVTGVDYSIKWVYVDSAGNPIK